MQAWSPLDIQVKARSYIQSHHCPFIRPSKLHFATCAAYCAKLCREQWAYWKTCLFLQNSKNVTSETIHSIKIVEIIKLIFIFI